ncbi:putative T7SS-secreted protein [Microbacterium sp. 22242]|uniref:putative T7SS-secreted protein n=1 Tax=Microbacterium sp. 22242 TaxID=3453896 RepID=UPI003F8625A1
MLELGQTRDPRDLIPESVSNLRWAAGDWRLRANDALTIRGLLAKLDDEGAWKGQAYDLYLARFERQLLHWQHTADQLTAGADAVSAYVDAAEWAQKQADQAITMWDDAEAQGAAALVAHSDYVRAVKARQGMRQVGADVPFQDPSGPAHQAAQELLYDARATLDVYARECITALDAATAAAAMPLTAAEAQDALNTKMSQVFVDVAVVKPFESFLGFLTAASKTLWEHPDILLELLGGAATVVGGAALGIGGGGLTITGAGALAGVPALAGAGALIGAGGAMIGDAAGRWFREAPEEHGIDRGDRRDTGGHFAKGGEGKPPWEVKEKQGLDQYSEENGGAKVIDDQVIARIADGPQNGRRYDGLVDNGDGTYTAVEVKSGSAFDKYNASSNTQRQFDEMVNNGTPAHARLDGKEIVIREVVVVKVP